MSADKLSRRLQIACGRPLHRRLTRHECCLERASSPLHRSCQSFRRCSAHSRHTTLASLAFHSLSHAISSRLLDRYLAMGDGGHVAALLGPLGGLSRLRILSSVPPGHSVASRALTSSPAVAARPARRHGGGRFCVGGPRRSPLPPRAARGHRQPRRWLQQQRQRRWQQRRRHSWPLWPLAARLTRPRLPRARASGAARGRGGHRGDGRWALGHAGPRSVHSSDAAVRRPRAAPAV